SATIPDRLTSRCPFSTRLKVAVLIPANPATAASDLPRAWRIRRRRQPIMRVVSVSIATWFVTVGGLRPDTRKRLRGDALWAERGPMVTGQAFDPVDSGC